MNPAVLFGFTPLIVALSISTACYADAVVSEGNPGAETAIGGERAAATQPPSPEGIPPDLAKAKPMVQTAPPKEELSAYRKRAPSLRPIDFGTVTKDIGGDVSTAPVSPEVERAIRYREGAAAPPRKSEKPKFRGGVDQAAGPRVTKTVFGTDDRVWIKYHAEYPFRAIGLLAMEFSGSISTCTGTLIGQRDVLTAAHCLYDAKHRLWADSARFYPGRNGQDNPYGYYEAGQFHALTGYINAQARDYDWEHMVHDLGLVTLSAGAGSQVGWLAFAYDDNLPPYVGNIVGYPGDKWPPFTLWRASCDIDPTDGYPSLFLTPCHTGPGSSGSSIYDYIGASQPRIVYGVNVAENSQYNVGVRITEPYFCWLRQTMGRRC